MREIVFHEQPSEDGFHYVYGVVYAPGLLDADGEAMTPDDVRRMAHDFIAQGRVLAVDVQHDRRCCGAQVVESFLARQGDPDYPAGAWVLGVRFAEGPLWDDIAAGKLNGFSLEAQVLRVPRRVLVRGPRLLALTTEPAATAETPEHRHELMLELDADGGVGFAVTARSQGHVHQVLGSMVSEEAAGHVHRFFLEESHA